MLVDQHRLESADLRALHAAWLKSGGEKACASSDHDVTGPPVIFPRRCFAELLKLKGDKGARDVLAKLPESDLRRLSVPNAFHDLDRPIGLAALHDNSPKR
jgi:CTP:molybdopterin cytidylyltransferase MocA